jgi:hypothetical protein
MALLLASGVLALCCCVDGPSAVTDPGSAPGSPGSGTQSQGLAGAWVGGGPTASFPDPAPDVAVGRGVETWVHDLALDETCDVHTGSTDARPSAPARPSLPAPPSAAAEQPTGATVLVATEVGPHLFDRLTPRHSPHQLCVMRT